MLCSELSCSQPIHILQQNSPCFSSTVTTEQGQVKFFLSNWLFCQRTSCQSFRLLKASVKVFFLAISHPSSPAIFNLFPLLFSCVLDYYFQGSLELSVTTCNATEASATKPVIDLRLFWKQKPPLSKHSSFTVLQT